ncbi:hypothetical protein EWH99_04065 [Sporolactobacillus sp. THM7-7]|nr:hypothetical protein EWH99_04065 [Sporolactobacillus sp. THM7-7]
MQQAAIHDFLVKYFKASGCRIFSEAHKDLLKVKLTKEMDKRLMNRPFYWHYIEKTGGIPETATLVFRTSPDLEEGEFVHFGSPRLHQILDSTKDLAPFIRLYQNLPSDSSPALEPWLGINYKISYQCDLKKDRICSVGLQLINGTLIDGFQEILQTLALTPKMPDYCYTLRPLVKTASGIGRIERFIESALKEEKTDWAQLAEKRWTRDRELLNAFYEQQNPKPESYFQECEALKEQYEPRILVQYINAGLFYLQSSSFLPGFPSKAR